MDEIKSLDDVADILLDYGFPMEKPNGTILTQVGSADNPFPTVIRINPEGSQIFITCRLGVLGDFSDDNIAAMALAALDINTCIRPFAFAIVSDTDDPELDDERYWPLVLTDSMPLGDLSSTELVAAMDALLQAVVTSRGVLEIGLGR